MSNSAPKSPPLWASPLRWLAVALALGGILLFFSALPHTADAEVLGKPVGHWSSLLPPLVAITLAIAFRSLVFSLSSAFFIGAILAFGPNPGAFLPGAATDFIWANLTNQFQIYIFGFLFCLIGMIHVTYTSGGIQAMVDQIARLARGRRSAQGVTFLAGLAVFFDDYSNTVVVGNTMRELTDRYRISREKLAYLVDSTTAPIAGLALVSTWIAFEVFLLGSAALSAGIPLDGYAIFFQMIPYRFYCLGTLLFLLLTVLTRREFGPMLRAEQRALQDGKLHRDGATLLVDENIQGVIRSKRPHWAYAAFPILLVIVTILGGILLVGSARHEGWYGVPVALLSMEGLRNAFGAAAYNIYNPDGPGVMQILFWASVIGGAVAILLPAAGRAMKPLDGFKAYGRALPTMWMAIFILIMAWSMKTICETLGTDTYIISVLGDRFPPFLLPLLTFLVAAGAAFAMGSSWATMGILIPVVLPLAGSLGLWDPTGGFLFFMTAAAVLDGAIFGDHCSPISDTTVLSSIASHCDHIDHVTTQVVYALAVMGLTGITGYLAVGLGLPLPFFFPLFLLAALALLFSIGKSPSQRPLSSS